MTSPITTHILNTSIGKPCDGVKVELEYLCSDGFFSKKGEGHTDNDGRVKNLLPDDSVLSEGIYRLKFYTSDYFSRNNISSFYPYITIVFEIKDPKEHYHVPLLLNPFGYSTYRGS